MLFGKAAPSFDTGLLACRESKGGLRNHRAPLHIWQNLNMPRGAFCRLFPGASPSSLVFDPTPAIYGSYR